MDAPPVLAIDTARLPWEERFNEKLGRALFRKNLITDPDTGMEVRLIRYPAGVINVRHASRSAGQERGLFPFSLSVDLSLHDADENVCPPNSRWQACRQPNSAIGTCWVTYPLPSECPQ